MNVKEKILNLPIWKAGILFLAFVISGVYILDVLLVSKIFSVLEGAVSAFSVAFEAEDREWREEYKQKEMRKKAEEEERKQRWNSFKKSHEDFIQINQKSKQ